MWPGCQISQGINEEKYTVFATNAFTSNKNNYTPPINSITQLSFISDQI